MKQEKFFCDQCEKDITFAKDEGDLRIVLTWQRREGIIICGFNDLTIKHFCGKGCLLTWLQNSND